MKLFKKRAKHSIIMKDIKDSFNIKRKDINANMYRYSNFVVLKDDKDREYNFIDLEVFPNLKELMICDYEIFNLYKDIISRCSQLESIIFINCKVNYKSKRKIIRQKIDDLSLFYAKYSKIRFNNPRCIKIIKITDLSGNASKGVMKLIGTEELRVRREKKERLNYLKNITRIKMMNAFNKNDDKR